jgi:hypothetical protein
MAPYRANFTLPLRKDQQVDGISVKLDIKESADCDRPRNCTTVPSALRCCQKLTLHCAANVARYCARSEVNTAVVVTFRRDIPPSLSATACPWKWRHYNPSKRRELLTQRQKPRILGLNLDTWRSDGSKDVTLYGLVHVYRRFSGIYFFQQHKKTEVPALLPNNIASYYIYVYFLFSICAIHFHNAEVRPWVALKFI